MKLLFFFSILGCLGYGAFWTLQKHPDLTGTLQEIIPSSEFHTLEIRYTPEQIMESHRGELLKSGRHKYLETETRFYPYLLMEVKYSISSKKTEESLILWDLSDGEMVLNTKGWEKTHGFGDCLTAGTSRREFSIIRLLAKKGGACERQEIINNLHLENETLDSLLESLKRKQLLVISGNRYRLHLENPNLKATPVTQMHERLVTKTGKRSKKVSKRFSLSQVERLTKAAFGDEFAIRHTTDVYLPVHSIIVQNPDGSLHTSLWNALNGKRILYSYGAD
ncbi:MAG: hypothetical protein JSS09_05520 [Verrucomicrobia bacterium]|nr:hypothetical protein [Verrucomicrobiota bacterium]